MAGANYMGGKRNTARTKSRDVVGRAQRRHFGKQRLASALCSTRVHESTRTVSDGITLAHARSGMKPITLSEEVGDISDHESMRAVIGRILEEADLVGLGARERGVDLMTDPDPWETIGRMLGLTESAEKARCGEGAPDVWEGGRWDKD